MMSNLLVLVMMTMLVPPLFEIGLDAAQASLFIAPSSRSRQHGIIGLQQQRRHDGDGADPRLPARRQSCFSGTSLFAKKNGKASQDRDRFDVSDYIHAVRDVVPPAQRPGARKKSSTEPRPTGRQGGSSSSSSPLSRTKRYGDAQAAGARAVSVDTPFQLKDNVPDLKTQLSLSRDGHACIRGLLQPHSIGGLYPLLIDYAQQRELYAWRQKVEVAANVDGTDHSRQKAMEMAKSCNTADQCRRVLSHLVGGHVSIPFLQFFNCWRDLPDVKALAERLAPVAATFLDVRTVRLYQDAVFWKRRSDGPTPWHADARMAPFDTSLMVTAWIPLQNVQSSGLVFASKSHADYSLLYWQQQNRLGETGIQLGDMSQRYTDIVDYMPLTLGDVTFHAGWTLHSADGAEERLALTITYVDAAAPIRADLGDGDDEDAWSYRDWIAEVPSGTRHWDHPLVPKLGRTSTTSSI